MKFFVVFCCLLISTSAIHHEIIQAKWAAYKAQHGKDYHPSEESTRLNNFLQSTLEIEQHNTRFHRGEVGYELGHNSLSDLTHEEVKTKFLGKKTMNIEGFNFTDVPPMASPFLPRNVDWRTKNIVTKPKNQASCGSCYSFGTVGVIESAIAQKTGELLDLSEQQVIDCSFGARGRMNAGCNGGHELVVMDFVSKKGLNDESAYKYLSGSTKHHSSCKHNSGPHAKGIKYRRIPPNDEDAVMQAIANYGTLVASISGENRDFQLFRGGIYDNPRCPKDVDHVISIVGYGSEDGRDYWIVKNSWGTHWGENGFAKILRGSNQCGIVSDNAWSIYL
ncbi:cathepsin L-like [Tropilaelaps mercedesae]|uniref:Cathepsin L-like n=1 Tax=Tropilaelaps mercedesae TaxID=418985 RepID=A0A1V9XSE4_9ACAR|nr:cathepsin L-like [Tropilaelaps mercedesae]